MTPSRTLLALLIGTGLIASGRLAVREWITGAACPSLGPIPACYIAWAGFLGMGSGLAMQIAKQRLGTLVFYTGLAFAGGLALFGSISELAIGGICPRTSGVPMCYLSLAMNLAIGGLYRLEFVRSATAPN